MQTKNFLDSKFGKNQYKLVKAHNSLIPLENDSIDYLIADGVLDSMMTSEILTSIDEIFRVIKKMV